MTVEEYKGYGIDFNVYGQQEYSVQVDGDDMLFKSLAGAKKFIDDIVEMDQM